MGKFNLDEFKHYFPNSKRFESLGSDVLFGVLAQRWLNGLDVSAATREEYKKALNKYWMPRLALKAIDEIRYSELRQEVNQIPWTTTKTRNNALIPLRGVFEAAFEDEVIERNPMARVKNLKHQKQPPDPFTREEMELIIKQLYEQYSAEDIVHAAYFEFAFYSGMRPSEMLALEWPDIDFRQGYARVEKAQSKGRLNDRTKNAEIRDVMLNDRSRQALMKMKSLTFLAGNKVFVSARTGESFKTEKSQRFVFTRVLRKLGIRHRKAYNTRHTYATMLLMDGVNPVFVAQQLGHSIMMTTTIYAKWIQGKRDKAEMDKLQVSV